MKHLLGRADELPVTFVIAIAYVTLTVLMDPMRPDHATLIAYGNCRGIDVADGQPWRLLSYTFAHNGGVVHLAMNLLALLWVGPPVERMLGSVRYALVYLLAGATGGIAGCFWHHPLAPLGGGSGAIFGLMGAVLAINARNGRHLLSFLEHSGGRAFMGQVVLCLLQGFLFPNVSNAAHIGGLAGGFVVTFFWFDLGRAGATVRRPWPRLLAAAVLLGACVYAVCPVTRWDYLLLQWQQAAPGPQRDELRAAFWLALGSNADPGEAETTKVLEQVQEARRGK